MELIQSVARYTGLSGRPWFDVRAYGATGDGTTNDYTAIQAAITAAGAVKGAVMIPPGTYAYGTTLDASFQGITIMGVGRPTLKFTGTGNALQLAMPTASTNRYDFCLRDFIIDGNANCTNGIYIQAYHHGFIENVEVRNVNAAGLRTEFSVCTQISNFIVSYAFGAWTQTPVNGIVFDKKGASELTVDCTVTNAIIEGVSGAGIRIIAGACNTFLGGTSEGNATGVQIDTGGVTSYQNVFKNMFCESNTVSDFVVNGNSNVFEGCTGWSNGSGDSANIQTGNANTFRNGRIYEMTVGTSSTNSVIDSIQLHESGTAITGSGYLLYGNVALVNGSTLVPSSYLTEGTFTPLMGGSTSNGSFTYSTNTGRWKRQGKTVYFDLAIVCATMPTAPTGDLRIRSLPVTSSASQNVAAPGLAQINLVDLAAGKSWITVYMSSNVTYLNFLENGDNVAAAIIQGTAVQATSRFFISGSYEV